MRVIYTSKGMSKKIGVRVIYRKIRYILKWDTGSLSRWPPLPYSVDSRVIVKWCIGMHLEGDMKLVFHHILLENEEICEISHSESQCACLDWSCASPEHKHREYPLHNLARSFVQAAKLNNFLIITAYGLTWLDTQHQETSSVQSMWAKSGDSQPPIRRTVAILFAG